MLDISPRLRSLRRDNGLSQRQMAESIGVPRQRYAKWEEGRGTPDYFSLLKWCMVYGLDMQQVIYDSIIDKKTVEGYGKPLAVAS